jgi:hypothetical protein
MPSTNCTANVLAIPAALFALFAFLAPSTPYAQASLSDLSDAYVFPGVYVSHNFREGYRNFDDADGYLHVENTNPLIIGAVIGKRISIDNLRFRFQAALEFGSGSVKDLEYETVLSDGNKEWPERVSLYSVYWTGGLLADAHLLFPSKDRTFFISAGLGAHLTYFDIALKVSSTGDKVSGVGDGMRGVISPSFNLGGGVEYPLAGFGAACVSYNLRIWRSANYREVSLPFPMGVNYTEFFFSQSIQVQFLLPKKKSD